MKVLIIEDEIHSQELLCLRLEGLGCDVSVADTGPAGLAMATDTHPDLVFVDLMLQDDETAGLNVIRQLRQNPATAGLAIIIHSVFVSRLADMPYAFPMVEGLLPKPFTVNQLKVLVEGARAVLADRHH